MHKEILDSEQNRIGPTEVEKVGNTVPSEKGLPVSCLRQNLSLIYEQTVRRKVVILTPQQLTQSSSERTMGITCAAQEVQNSGAILVCPINTKLSNNILSHLH